MESKNILKKYFHLPFFLPVFSGFLTVLLFPRIGAFWLAFFCLFPLLMDLDRCFEGGGGSVRAFFVRGVVFGFVLMGIFHLWMFELQAFVAWYWVFAAWLALSLYLSLFYGFSFGLYYFCRGLVRDRWRFAPVYTLLLFPCCWVIGEWLRSLGPLGNPGGLLGYSQSSSLFVLQLASVFGVFGVSFFCVLVNVLLYFVFTRWSGGLGRLSFRILVGMLCLVLGFGMFRVFGGHREGIPVRVAVVQGNHSQDFKFARRSWPVIRQDYLSLTASLAGFGPEVILWPETITPDLNLRRQSFTDPITSLAASMDTRIVFGSPILENGRYFNAMVYAAPEGIGPGVYRKVQLMPFGEYWPAKGLLKRLNFGKWVLGSDFSPGDAYTAIQVSPDLRLAGAVCLESVYPWFFRRGALQGADFLGVLANHAWFFDSTAAEKHLQMSVMRAVETHRYLLHAANTGVSAIVGPRGRILEKMGLDERGVLVGEIYRGLGGSIYTWIGDIVVWMSILLVFSLFVFFRKKRKD